MLENHWWVVILNRFNCADCHSLHLLHNGALPRLSSTCKENKNRQRLKIHSRWPRNVNRQPARRLTSGPLSRLQLACSLLLHLQLRQFHLQSEINTELAQPLKRNTNRPPSYSLLSITPLYFS